MSENVLIPLAGFRLPADFAWQVGFVALVDEQLRRLRATGRFLPPRFFGYFFRGDLPVGVAGSWTVSLDAVPPMTQLPQVLERFTHGQYPIVSASRGTKPEFLLVHDRRDGACWLWSFADGLTFIESAEPVLSHSDGVTNQKLLGP